jgi:hypothetical protein
MTGRASPHQTPDSNAQRHATNKLHSQQQLHTRVQTSRQARRAAPARHHKRIPIKHRHKPSDSSRTHLDIRHTKQAGSTTSPGATGRLDRSMRESQMRGLGTARSPGEQSRRWGKGRRAAVLTRARRRRPRRRHPPRPPPRRRCSPPSARSAGCCPPRRSRRPTHRSHSTRSRRPLRYARRG